MYMGSRELGLLRVLLQVVSSYDGEERNVALGILWLLLLLNRGNVAEFVSVEGMRVVLSVLTLSESGVNVLGEDAFYILMTVLMVASRDPTAAVALRIAGGLSVIEEHLDHKDPAVAMQATMIVSFLTGRDDSSTQSGSTAALLESRPKFAERFEALFDNTVHGRDGTGYRFADFALNVIVAAVGSLVISDSNKRILASMSSFTANLTVVLRLFADNAPRIAYTGSLENGSPVSVGGGGTTLSRQSSRQRRCCSCHSSMTASQSYAARTSPCAPTCWMC